jgi:hypothetical protein
VIDDDSQFLLCIEQAGNVAPVNHHPILQPDCLPDLRRTPIDEDAPSLDPRLDLTA